LFRAKLAQAKADRNDEKLGQRAESLAALAEAAALLPALDLGDAAARELRNEVIGKLTLADLRLEPQWEGLTQGTAFAFDPKLKRYAREGEKGGVSVRWVEGDQEPMHLSAPEGAGPAVAHLLFSPDDRFLTAVYTPPRGADSVRRCCVWDLASRAVVLASPCTAGGPCFSRDGRRLAFGHPDGSVRLHDLPSGREDRQLSPGMSPTLLQFDPAGDRLAVADPGDKAVRLVSLADGRVTFRLNHEGGVTALAWHPKGHVLATADPGHLTLWETVPSPRRPSALD
jgi:WD40 repeat protein